ncbi:glucan endo-1,3-alpha-glucosidase, partial [Phenoliferia sp. Uapishka_3]
MHYPLSLRVSGILLYLLPSLSLARPDAHQAARMERRHRNVTVQQTATTSASPMDSTGSVTVLGSAVGSSSVATSGGTSSARASSTSGKATTSSSSNSASGRKVFAHVVMGNWQSYTSSDWEADITLAKSANIDAFALNVGHDASDPTQLALAYSAAESVGGFKLFISLDMSYASLFGSSDQIIAEYIAPFAGRSGQFLYNGKPLLSTFSGESGANLLEGNADINAAWSTLKSKASAQGFNIFFMPFWTGLDGNTAVSSHPVVDGIGQWLAWPTGNTSPSTDIDASFQNDALKNNKVFCAPVSPWFHVHEVSGNNYIYKSDEHLIVTRYQQLLAMDHVPDLIEILTWNDYGESHYIGPVRASAGLPGGTVSSSTYVSEAPHSDIIGLISILNLYYKSGSWPSIGQTQAYYWYRQHPKGATATSDPLGLPKNSDWTDDTVYIAVVVAPGSKATSLVITLGGTTTTKPITAGNVNLVKAPLSVGTPVFSFLDSSSTVLAAQSGSAITGSSEFYSFNYVAGVLNL